MGRSAVFFSLLLRDREFLNVCDLFESENNISQSGFGKKEDFLENMRKFSDKGVNEIHTCLSSELNADIIGDGYRMFHIDGGHLKEEALFDLVLAAGVIHDNGVIILDDPFRPEWPGVTEAAIDFLTRFDDFVAIAVGFNKLIISKRKSADSYIDWLENPANLKLIGLDYPIFQKQLPFCNSPLLIFYHPSYIPENKFRAEMLKLKNAVSRKILAAKRRIFPSN